MKTVCVIGSGTMGNGIAHTFAQFGCTVHLVDIRQDALQRAVQTIEKNLERQVQKGSIHAALKSETLARITTFTELEKACATADIVIEAASEQLQVKTQIFKDLDAICKPGTILATNTSSISITQLAAATNRPQDVIGMHFMNPVPVMILVEVIRGYNTSDATCNAVMELSKHLHKIPVEVRDYPGFVANKILMPMINEAVYTLQEGVAGVTEIDTVMKLGMAHPMGPLQLADFIGLDVCLSILEVLQKGYGQPKYAPCPLLVNMVRAGHLGVKSGMGFYEYKPGIKELKVSPFIH
ncbi:MAG: 3-hydroxybutyryl-CoA dehydrogenase [Bacteroidia bacterium]